MSSDEGGVKPIRVLLASSSQAMRDILVWSLSDDTRFSVMTQAVDTESVSSYRGSCDLAIVDLRIAGLGVLEVVRQLRNRRPPLPVLVIADTGAVYQRHALEAEGVADYLVIPGDLDELPDRLVEAAMPGLLIRR